MYDIVLSATMRSVTGLVRKHTQPDVVPRAGLSP
jgi:hypothetical protein